MNGPPKRWHHSYRLKAKAQRITRDMATETSAITTSGRLIRIFVMGLPLGLIVMGALSFVFYFNKKNADKPAASKLAEMLRRDPNVDDFNRYTRILTQDVGARNVRHLENLEAAAAFVDSTLGFDSMGYQTVRREFDSAGRKLVNVSVDLPGKKKPEEVVLVLAAYDSSDEVKPEEAEGVATLFALAHSMTSKTYDRTVRFAAVVEASAANPSENGASILAQDYLSLEEKVVSVLVLPPLPTNWQMPAEWNASRISFGKVVKDEFVKSATDLQQQIEQAASTQ
jgi:hypothetical protein